MKHSVQDHWFPSEGLRCGASLYLPATQAAAPLILMAHGFGAERTFGLQPFIERFVDAGMAVFSFDYRCFGNSEGEPRNWVSPRRHLADWQAALRYVRTLAEIDPARIGLWGTSFSGGHALITAARNPDVGAVMAQVPFVDGLATTRLFSPGYILESLGHGLADMARMIRGKPAYTVPVVAEPGGGFALLNVPGAKEFMDSMEPSPSWENAVPARIVLSLASYRPIRYARKVHCPVLIPYALHDDLIPASAVERTIELLPHARGIPLDVGHFEVYQGACFEHVIAEEVAFFKTHLQVQG